MSSCATTLPTKPKDSIADEVAPMFISKGQIINEEIATNTNVSNLSLLVDFLGFAPLAPQPNHPQMPPAIKIN